MISFPLFKNNMTISFKIMILFIAIMAMYTTIIIYMFDPSIAYMLQDYQQALPEMMTAFGMSGVGESLIEFIQIYLYGFIMLVFPMVYSIILVSKLIVRYVDSGSMACLLASPNSRTKIIITQLLSIIINIILLMAIITVIGIIASETMFPEELDIKKYLLLNISTTLLHLSVGSIIFMSACLFNEKKWYYTIGAGIPVLFFLFNMLGNMGEDIEFFKYLTLFTLLPDDKIVAGESGILAPCLILLIISIVLYASGVLYFKKKDLPL